MEEKELSAWLSICQTPKLNNNHIQLLLQHVENPVQIFDDKSLPKRIKQQDVLRIIERCKQHKSKPARLNEIEKALRWQKQDRHHLITIHCENYPPLLKEIPDPPPLLYVVGSVEDLSLPQIAIVGSRKASPGGKVMAKRLAEDLAVIGYSICSGMALGIDSESHLGALESQGKSVAVLGCGIDKIYPKSNSKLANLLAQQGALVSEFSLGTPPRPWHFPQRNRIISGLSQGVVVVEAAVKSGSLITARFALEQGREIFAVPGSPHNPQAKGCHYLLKNGAKLVEQAEDIIEELGVFIELGRQQLSMRSNETKALNIEEQALLNHMDYEPTSIELLIHHTGIDAELIGSMLTALELEGLIISRQGGYSLSPA